ncbi:uncharacterized protein LOC128556683 [Mercenaria mercenaria]|uniref:uncharacterized protein LOC123523257 n=1 Tax=Mercenaria mercenaria TaxID=6596 RepID=UPI00234E9961|nr:uncharacterized protein LOC123523257 [Mercenaria mercenaria]XP_053398273.1 uncharacterized protein LOC128556683 [Mercenaria mercenaria]
MTRFSRKTITESSARMMADVPLKKRKENWTRAEGEALKSAYFERASIVDGRLGPKLRAVDKERCWREIEDSVNAQGTCIRTMEECKKKLSDIKTDVKKKERRRRQMAATTGGGPPPMLEDWEDKVNK